MKKTLITISLILIVAYSTYGSAVQFTVEVDQLILNGDPQNHADRDANNLDAFGFFVSEADFSSFVNDSIWDGSESSITTEEYNNVFTFLNQNGYADAVQVVEPPLAIFPVFSGELDAGGADFHAVMVVTGSVGGSDYLGVVATTGVTADLGSFPVGFLTGTSWDTTLLGTAGSLSLASVVPEPSTYAAFAGLLALGYVMVRRRRA